MFFSEEKNSGCRNLKSLLSIDNFPHSRGEGYRGLSPQGGGGADFQIFSFMFPATMPDVWGRAERPPNDDRKREFVNSKSNYLGEITFGGD